MNFLRLGLIGCGKMMGAHVRGVQHVENVEIVSVCDIIRENAERVSAELCKRLESSSHIAARRSDSSTISCNFESCRIPCVLGPNATLSKMLKGNGLGF